MHVQSIWYSITGKAKYLNQSKEHEGSYVSVYVEKDGA